VLVLAGLGFAAAGASAQPSLRPAKEAVVRVTDDQMHQLDFATVEPHLFRTYRTAIGQIGFDEDSSTIVLTPFSGRVARLIARVGDKVKRGDFLMEIDSPDVLPPQNDFIAASTALARAQSQLDLARTTETRAKSLFEGKAGPLKDLEAAQSQLLAAENTARAADVALEAARARLRILGRSEAEIAALQSRGAVSRSYMVVAPIDGTVIARKVGPGQFVRSDASEPLFTIADLSRMWIKAQVPETDIPFVRIGQDVEVRVAALPGKTFTARVTAIGAASDSTTRRIVVRSEVPNPDGVLKSEMFANVRIVSNGGQVTASVPPTAVIREGDHAAVWVEAARVVLPGRDVKLGMETGSRQQILEGLKPGERVVSRGAIFVENEWRQ
jgi:cobalt-zinc-cadmium efflux system membrane fusion protein